MRCKFVVFFFFLPCIPSRLLYHSLVSFQPKADPLLGVMACNFSLVTSLLSFPSCSLFASAQGCHLSSEQLLPEMFAAAHLHLPGAWTEHLDTRARSPQCCAVLRPAGSCRGDTAGNRGLLSHPPSCHHPLSADQCCWEAWSPACPLEPRNAPGLR